MALPKQVQAQLDNADAMLAEVNGQPASSELATLAATEQVIEPVQQAEPPQAVEPEVHVVAEPQPQPDPFEARYKVLQGKYNAEVPALHRKVHELESDLRTAIERLERASAERESATATQHVSDTKDVENFGADLVEMVNRVSSSAMSKALKQMETRAATIEAQMRKLIEQVSGVTQHTAQTAEEMFFDKLAKLVPDWERINADKAFLAWLAEVDPVYGVPRQKALEQAQKTLSADRAASVFLAFAGPRQAAPKPDPLEKQVSPKGAGSAPPPSGEKPVIKQAQITQFYDEVRRGQYRGREAEAARIEQLINTALAEGRVI